MTDRDRLVALLREGIDNMPSDDHTEALADWLLARDLTLAPQPASDGAALQNVATELCRLWFDLAGPANKAATYAALVSATDDTFSEAMWRLRAALQAAVPPSAPDGGRED